MNGCPSLSPQSGTPCRFPDDPELHEFGPRRRHRHESDLLPETVTRVVWPATDEELERWAVPRG